MNFRILVLCVALLSGHFAQAIEVKVWTLMGHKWTFDLSPETTMLDIKKLALQELRKSGYRLESLKIVYKSMIREDQMSLKDISYVEQENLHLFIYYRQFEAPAPNSEPNSEED